MKKPKEKWIRFRISTILVFFCLLAFIVAGRAFQLQVLKREQLCKLAERQYKNKTPLIPKRGTIYSRGYEELAVTVEVDSGYAEPDSIESPKRAAKRLSPLLSVGRTELEGCLCMYYSLARPGIKVADPITERIKSLD